MLQAKFSPAVISLNDRIPNNRI